MWDSRFEEILRTYLPFLPAGTTLDARADLRDLGLDSLGTVELIAALENAYGVRFRDDSLRIEHFTTAEGTWRALDGLRETAA